MARMWPVNRGGRREEVLALAEIPAELCPGFSKSKSSEFRAPVWQLYTLRQFDAVRTTKTAKKTTPTGVNTKTRAIQPV